MDNNFKKKKLPGYGKVKELETFYITMDDMDQTSGLRSISLVRDPAIGIMALCFNKQEKIDLQFKALKKEKKIVGFTMIPNLKLYRENEFGEGYNLVFTEDIIKRLVDKFNKGNNNKSVNIEHKDNMVNGFISANWIVADKEFDKSRHYGFKNIIPGSHFMEVQVEDQDFWDSYVEKEPLGFSVEGIFGVEAKPQKFSLEQFSDDEIKELFFEIFKDFK
jgi:hypothetical protein